MSALGAFEASIVDREGPVAPAAPPSGGTRRGLRLVRPVTAPGAMPGSARPRCGPEPRFSSMKAPPGRAKADEVLIPSAVIAPRRARHVAPPGAIRLTRRGWLVVAALVVGVVAVVAFVVGRAVAGGAEATSHGQPGAGSQRMHEIVVRPGQTLWAIASTVKPGADPLDVVRQIMTANAMSSADIRAGQLLWVPG